MRYILSRFANLIITLLLVSAVIFIVFQVLPGDPALLRLGADADEARLAALREEMGLNAPAVIRYLKWLSGIPRGDLGASLRFGLPVTGLIAARLPVTFSLAAITLLITVIVGFPVSVLLTLRPKSVLSGVMSAFSQIGLAVPVFWLSMMLALLLSVNLKWLPAVGYSPLSSGFVKWLASLAIPAIALSVGNTAYIIRFLRSSILTELEKDYVRTAKSKGMKTRRILLSVVLRNALIPVVTVFGLLVIETLGGSILVENMFNLSGLGSLITFSISSRDYTLTAGITLYISFIVAALNFVVDIVYSAIDPRVKAKGNSVR